MTKLLSCYALDVKYNFFGKNRDRFIYISMTQGSSHSAKYAPWRGLRREAAQVLTYNFSDTSEADIAINRQPMISNMQGCTGHPELEKYLIQLQHHKFVVSPMVQMPTEHWEALMMHCILIVLKGPCDELYVGLRVLMLDSWDELTQKHILRSIMDNINSILTGCLHHTCLG